MEAQNEDYYNFLLLECGLGLLHLHVNLVILCNRDRRGEQDALQRTRRSTSHKLVVVPTFQGLLFLIPFLVRFTSKYEVNVLY